MREELSELVSSCPGFVVVENLDGFGDLGGPVRVQRNRSKTDHFLSCANARSPGVRSRVTADVLDLAIKLLNLALPEPSQWSPYVDEFDRYGAGPTLQAALCNQIAAQLRSQRHHEPVETFGLTKGSSVRAASCSVALLIAAPTE
ncbi:hypothetical protein [Glycomyces tenuis]|uniref:hypothetical protein n=1 Tax=Glycomyces tenuis TaxID=58116 RepID=UPI00047D48B2|nr:hypothetical protein [Glycomyces tenuis]